MFILALFSENTIHREYVLFILALLTFPFNFFYHFTNTLEDALFFKSMVIENVFMNLVSRSKKNQFTLSLRLGKLVCVLEIGTCYTH